VSSVNFIIGLTSDNLQTNLNFALDLYEDTTIYISFNPLQSIPYSDSLHIVLSNTSVIDLPLSGTGLGNEKPKNDSLLVIFPNPANDFIYVSLNSNLFAEFTLYDTSIKKILKVSFNDVTKIDLTNLSKGIYLYQCKLSDGSSKNGKLVKF